MCLAIPANRFLPPPPEPVPKRRLEIQQSQPVWELNNQQPYAEIRRDRTAIQTAGAVSGGLSSEMWRKERFTRVPSRPTPVAMVAPLPASRAAGTVPRPRTGLGARWAFPRASWFVVEGSQSGSRPGRMSRPRRGPGVRLAAAPAQPGHASAGATSREASSRTERRPLGAAPGSSGAGPWSPATVIQETASLPRPRPRRARVPATPASPPRL